MAKKRRQCAERANARLETIGSGTSGRSSGRASATKLLENLDRRVALKVNAIDVIGRMVCSIRLLNDR